MKERITKNEERLDNIIKSVNNLNNALTSFSKEKKNIILLSNYYKSKKWLKDKDDYESGKISNIKAGVLSEDLVWNTLENIDELLNEMEILIKFFKKKEINIQQCRNCGKCYAPEEYSKCPYCHKDQK